MSLFKRAEKKRVFLKIALDGPPGSGKTLTSLLIARGLLGPDAKVAVIDTENESASLYADKPVNVGKEPPLVFDTAAMSPPFLTGKYIRAIDDAVALGYNVIIVDSLSHAWAGPGGIKERKDMVDAKGGNQFTNWAPFSKEHQAFLAKILHSPVDIICTMRSKVDYILETNDKGKQTPRRVGMAPEQRPGMEYEFSVMFSIDSNHLLTASKDRTSLFRGKILEMDEATAIQIGRDLSDWRASGKELDPVTPPPAATTTKTQTPPAAGQNKAAPQQRPPAKTPAPPPPEPEEELPSTGGLTEPPDDYDSEGSPEDGAGEDPPELDTSEQIDPGPDDLPPEDPATEADIEPEPEPAPPPPPKPKPAATRKKKDDRPAQAPPPPKFPEDGYKPTAAALKGTLENLWEHGKNCGLKNAEMAEIMEHRTGKKVWNDLTNFEVKALRNAFTDAKKKGGS